MLRLILTLVLATGLCTVGTHAEELAVIVNPDSQVDTLSRRDAINIFMGRYQRLTSDVAAEPLDLGIKKEEFYLLLTRRTLPEINAYWARLVFSGRGAPPAQLDDAEQVIERVASNRGSIGYIPQSKVDDRVRVVLRLYE